MLALCGVVLAAALSPARSREHETAVDENIDYGNHNLRWEDGPSSWEEFGHDNDPEVCGLQFLTVREWEEGRYWERDEPVIVKNVTAGWAARHNWKLDEMLRRYPDAEATMGEGRRVGEIGPDEAGNLLQHTTVKEFITEHMYNPDKYFFDRKIAIPQGMLEDCHPYPMPTRDFLKDPLGKGIYAPAKKAKVDPRPEEGIWMDHLAIAIGSDLQGLSFHFHGSAWNTVIFGTKRWILYDHKRWMVDDEDRYLQRRVALASDDAWETILSTPEWIRQLYDDPFRKNEIRTHGHDCIQEAGDMMYVPKSWMHMVVNIGDTVSVISEVGLDKGEGKTEEDFSYDPFESSSDDEEEDWEEDWSDDDFTPCPVCVDGLTADETTSLGGERTCATLIVDAKEEHAKSRTCNDMQGAQSICCPE